MTVTWRHGIYANDPAVPLTWDPKAMNYCTVYRLIAAPADGTIPMIEQSFNSAPGGVLL